MKTTLKAVGLVSSLVVAALVGGTLISAVSASPGSPAKSSGTGIVADDLGTTAYCELWRQTFADELGVSVDDLTPAGKAAAIATIDQAVADGKLSEDVGTRMKERIQASDADGCHLMGAGFPGWGRHAGRAEFRLDWISAAADALQMDPADLVSSLRAGESLQDVSEAQGVEYADVSQAVLDAATAELDSLVQAGTITQEQADLHLASLTERLESGEFPPMRGPAGGPGMGKGMGQRSMWNGGYGIGNGSGAGAFSS